MTRISKETLHLRALNHVALNGRRGLLMAIGSETRSQQELVEAGHLFQEIASGNLYKFTLSPSGRRLLDNTEGHTP